MAGRMIGALSPLLLAKQFRSLGDGKCGVTVSERINYVARAAGTYSTVLAATVRQRLRTSHVHFLCTVLAAVGRGYSRQYRHHG